MRVAAESSTRPRSQTDGRRHANRSGVQERTTQLERFIQHHYKTSPGTTLGHDAVKRALADETPADGSDPSSVIARRSRAEGHGRDRISVEGLSYLIDPAIRLEPIVGEVVGMREHQRPPASQ